MRSIMATILVLLVLSVLGSDTTGKEMDVSNVGIELIKDFEGLRLTGYKDITGIPTIGYGSARVYPDTGKKILVGDVISEARAEAMLRLEVEYFVLAVRRNVKTKISQNQFDALVSFTYNLGEGALIKICENINRDDFEGAYKRMLLYDNARIDGELKKVKGLTRRRRAEVELFRKGMI